MSPAPVCKTGVIKPRGGRTRGSIPSRPTEKTSNRERLRTNSIPRFTIFVFHPSTARSSIGLGRQFLTLERWVRFPYEPLVEGRRAKRESKHLNVQTSWGSSRFHTAARSVRFRSLQYLDRRLPVPSMPTRAATSPRQVHCGKFTAASSPRQVHRGKFTAVSSLRDAAARKRALICVVKATSRRKAAGYGLPGRFAKPETYSIVIRVQIPCLPLAGHRALSINNRNRL